MNVEIVQKRLWEQSQQHRKHRESDTPLFPVDRYEGRIRNLMDLMHQPQWIATACDRVLKRSRKSLRRSVWKAGCRETGTSGLGLGRGVKPPRLHHPGR